MGDENKDYLPNAYNLWKVDILKVGHHKFYL